jgi:hypothetical protein
MRALLCATRLAGSTAVGATIYAAYVLAMAAPTAGERQRTPKSLAHCVLERDLTYLFAEWTGLFQRIAARFNRADLDEINQQIRAGIFAIERGALIAVRTQFLEDPNEPQPLARRLAVILGEPRHNRYARVWSKKRASETASAGRYRWSSGAAISHLRRRYYRAKARDFGLKHEAWPKFLLRADRRFNLTPMNLKR